MGSPAWPRDRRHRDRHERRLVATGAQTPVKADVRQKQGTLGAPTFGNPYGSAESGEKVPPNATVRVSCKVHAPWLASASPEGYWYRIESPPWNGEFWVVANTFLNGGTYRGAGVKYTDHRVPDCIEG